MSRRCGLFLLLICVLVACTSPTVAPTPTAAPPTVTPTASPVTESPPPATSRLTVCSVDPRTINPFTPTQAGRDLLGLFYIEPAEYINHRWEPRLLERLPSLENGDAFTRTVVVEQGATYADPVGALLIYTGSATLDLPQLVVTFTLTEGLRWSDGEPLTSADVILSYHLAQDLEATGRWADLVKRTARLEALDARTLRWEGVPGYLSADFPGFLFPPFPAHRWRTLRLGQVLQDRQPLATGPFVITSWEPGNQIVLHPNPYYSGQPSQLDELVVRFPQVGLSAWPQLLTTGECDVILPDPAMNIEWQSWARLAVEGSAVIWANTASTFLRLDFNVVSPSPLQNRDLRLALAMCIDRLRLTDALAGNALLPAETFLRPGHPAFAGAALPRVAYNPTQAQELLDTLGWRDTNGDGFREAVDVPGLANGTPLSLTLYTATWYTVAAAHLFSDLEACGVDIAPMPTDARYLYAADPAAPLAGRQFDLVFYGWSASPAAICGAWRTERIPGPENAWEGENFSGYSSPEYDAACLRALDALDTDTQTAALREAQLLLADDLPTFFITWRPYWFVARPEVQGLRPFAELPALWNVEMVQVQR